jgi:hypothetical protein
MRFEELLAKPEWVCALLILIQNRKEAGTEQAS